MVPIQQGFSGASKAPERGAGCPHPISSCPPPKAGREKAGPESVQIMYVITLGKCEIDN
jgi:hypothetical protein